MDYGRLFLCIQDNERKLLVRQSFVLRFWERIVDVALRYMSLIYLVRFFITLVIERYSENCSKSIR